MAKISKAQKGKDLKPTPDSTAYFKKKADSLLSSSNSKYQKGDFKGGKKDSDKSIKALYDEYRQSEKGRPGKDANGFPIKKQKSGGKTMMKRADGSTSQRGLWDNIRANKGSGKKPTSAMLKQEKKIKAASKKK